ncbi:MAG: peroxiredoxin-like family protein, partial [Cyanobacteria bacterium P01_A01_bin.83]
MNLTQELANYQSQFQTKVPAQLQSVMKRATKDLADSHIIDRTLKVGDRIPLFSLPDALGENFEIKTALQQGYGVISFYRGGWCPYCNLELKALQRILPDIEAAGAKLIAISPETPDSSLSTKEKNELDFVVLSDQGNKVAQEFGLVFELPMELRPIYQ